MFSNIATSRRGRAGMSTALRRIVVEISRRITEEHVMSMQFETISVSHLTRVTGAAGQPPAQPAQPPRPATPPPRITTGDVVEATGRATEAVLAPPTLIGNLGQAYRQFNDPRVGTGFWDRTAYGFTGLFGIDPLK
jgi:hypothetical protein